MDIKNDYRILLPVTNSPDLVRQKLKDITDKEKLILVNNFDNPEVLQLSKKAEDKGAEVYYFPQNLGLAASWNLGLERMKEERILFVVFLSASAVFSKPIEKFIDKVFECEDKGESQCRYVASGAATLHCFAHTYESYEVGGLFDENFYPIYLEDTDYCRRSLKNGLQERVRLLHLEDVVYSHSFANAVRNDRLRMLYENNAARMGDYYERKWGGSPGEETFPFPFNNETLGVNWWQLEVHLSHRLIPQKPYTRLTDIRK